MELFPDGAPVRLRSRACELFLHADEDGVGVSLSPLRASPRTSWEVRHVERHVTAYILLRSAADGRYLAISRHPAQAQPGARGLRVRAVQSPAPGVEWSARLAADGGRDVLIAHSVHGLLCPVGCAGGVGVLQRVNGRSSLLPRWSVEPAPVAPAPPTPVVPQSPAMENGLPRPPVRRGRRGGKSRIWAPVLSVIGASRGPFWVPLVDVGARHAGYLSQQHGMVGLPDVGRGGDLDLEAMGGGGGMIVVLAADEVVATLADAPGTGKLWQNLRLRGRVGPGQRRSASASPRAAVFLPLPLEVEVEVDLDQPPPAAAQPLAMGTRLEKLYESLEDKHRSIRHHIDRARAIEMLARTGTYDSDTPVRKAVEDEEKAVVALVESYNVIKIEVEELSAEIAEGGLTPAAPPALVRDSPNIEHLLTRSIRRRRLLRRQLLREEDKANRDA